MAKKYTVEVAYSEQSDMTFIYENCEDNGEIVSTEVVGFYHGHPDTEKTSQYYGKLKAEY